MFYRIIELNFHTGGTTMGRGGLGLRSPLEILRCLQSNFGTPSEQEEEDATVGFALPMDQDDTPEVMMLQIDETQLIFLAHPEDGRGYTDVQMICQATANLQAHGHLYAEALTIWL